MEMLIVTIVGALAAVIFAIWIVVRIIAEGVADGIRMERRDAPTENGVEA